MRVGPRPFGRRVARIAHVAPQRACFALTVLTALTALLALAAAASAAEPCADPAALRAETRGIAIALVPRPAPVPVGRHFSVDLQLCQGAAGVRGLRLDADMPAHRHGMNYRAGVRRLADDRWRAEGLMFHMRGRWRFIVDLDTADGELRLVRELEVE